MEIISETKPDRNKLNLHAEKRGHCDTVWLEKRSNWIERDQNGQSGIQYGINTPPPPGSLLLFEVTFKQYIYPNPETVVKGTKLYQYLKVWREKVDILNVWSFNQLMPI